MSLLREIENEVADPNGSVVSILLKCKILAARLGSAELTGWVDWELNGYPESQPIPDYRRLAITYYANFMNLAWQASRQSIPIHIVPEKYREAFRSVEFRDGIAKTESFRAKGATVLRPELVPAIEGKMYPTMNCSGVWYEISGSEFTQLISAIKNRLLDFVLKIEAENPDAGDAPMNSHPVAREKLQPLVNNCFGTVGNVAQNSHHFEQTAEVGLDLQSLSKFVTEFTDHLEELAIDSHLKRKAEAQLATLKAQLTDEPDPLIVHQAGRTLRNITEGAIGSLLATAAQPNVWQWIRQTMDALFRQR